MKICMITFQYPPFFNGGVGSVVYRLARNLSKAGLAIHVVAPGQNQIENPIVPVMEDGVVVHRTYPGLGNYFGDPVQSGMIGDYIIGLHREIDFDALHCHFLIPPGLIGAVVSREIDRPFIASIHGSDVETMRYHPVLVGAVQRVLKQAHMVTSVTGDLMRKARHLTSISNCRVIPNAFESDVFDSRSLREIAENQSFQFQVSIETFYRLKRKCGLVVGTTGMIRPIKGFAFLLEAFKQLADQCPDALLLIVGDFVDPKEKEEQVKRIKSLGLKRRVFITGIAPPRQVLAWVKEMDIFAFPSLHEGSPCALLEAMACGLPVVASNVGGIPDMISHEENGLLVSPANAVELTDQLLLLARDETLRKRLGLAAAQTVQSRHQPDLETQAWIDLYHSVTGIPKETAQMNPEPIPG